MRVTPASLYRNLLYIAAGIFVFYTVYSIVGYDDGNTHVHEHRRQKHLFLTVSKDRIAERFGTLSPKRILPWTTLFGNPVNHEIMRECRGLEDRCIIITDRSQASSADVIFFHGPNINVVDMPDPETRNASQYYVYANMETPSNTHLHVKPLGSSFENYFNWTMTFLLNSDAVWKYGPFWIESKEAEQRGFKIESFHIDVAKLRKTKSGVFGLVSNCDAKDREKFLKELAKHINVTIGGKCANSPEYKQICPKGKDCQDMYEQYPFYIALENMICKDYVTEKYWDRTRYASIPIVWKRSVMESTNPPPKSFIAVDDYKTIKELAEYLKKLENDPKAYAEYFSWRINQQWTYAPWNTKGFRNGFCKLCEKLWDGPHEPKSIVDIDAWYEKESSCNNKDFFRSYFDSL